MLQTRGASPRLYFESDGELWTMEAGTGEATLVYAPPEGSVIREVASSPSGDRAATVLVREEDDAEVADLVVLTAGGDEVYRHDQITALTAIEGSRVVSLDWSPQGEKLLLAASPGGLISASLADNAEPKLIVSGGVAEQPDQAAWSPTGEELGFLADTEADRANIYLAGASASPTAPEPLLPVEDTAQIILDWAWLPDGRSLLFSEERGLTATADLWRIRSDGTGRQLVASAGSVAPVARIVGATPSRDGRSVAYIVLIPENGNEAFDSLWVRDLQTNVGFAIDVPEGQSVTDVWWTNVGLMFRAVPDSAFAGRYGGGPFALYTATDGTGATVVYEVGMDAAATPVATPVSEDS
jgi:dipeptidyl aminopeptidase/acylaminoacyl peptidase